MCVGGLSKQYAWALISILSPATAYRYVAGLSKSGPENSTIVVFPKLFIVCPPSYITSPGSQVTLEDISSRVEVPLTGPISKYKFVEFIVPKTRRALWAWNSLWSGLAWNSLWALSDF